MTAATRVCCSMISESHTRYGSRFSRHGNARACASYHVSNCERNICLRAPVRDFASTEFIAGARIVPREVTTENRMSSIDPIPRARNNSRAWHPQHSVDPFTPNHSEEQYVRLQPQGGRRVGACQQDHWQRCRTSGERDSRIHQVPERRGCSGGAHALHQSFARGFKKTYGIRRLHGAAAATPAEIMRAGTRDTPRCVSILMLLFVFIAILFLSSCGHPKQAQVSVPPPPPLAPEAAPKSSPTAEAKAQPPANIPSPREKANRKPEEEADLAEPTLPVDAKPVATETGLASWYGPPYHNRRGSNGEIYNMHAMTAAHRTFPLGSIVRVTNVKTGSTVLVRITDRGPFIPGRIVDLSLAAARKVDVWQPGIAEVKVELMQSGVQAPSSGKWAVQIGGMPDEKAASKLADHLTRRYHSAKVLRFKSPAGDWWIRVRVLDDDHDRAQKLATETATPEGAVFLVRLD